MKAKQFYSSMAWKYCSRYVLLYYANDDHVVQCATSGEFMSINSSKCHCGHYIKVYDMSKTNFAVAFNFENLAPQSHRENIYAGGRAEVMKEWLIKKHGIELIDLLQIRKHNICKLDKFTLEYWKDHYKKLFDDLVKVKGNPWENK